MKSLEIVNREIDKLKAVIDLGVIQKRNVELQNIDIAKLKELEQIKQDLEVLEIIKNKNVDLKMFKRLYKEEYMPTLSCNRFLYVYNWTRGLGESELTMEELLKLKQWLEENENV